MTAAPAIVRHFVPTPAGTIHCAIAGEGPPVLLLHQTPRSWDEFREVLPLLGRHFRAIAMDTIGYGDSDKPPFGNDTVEGWAAAAIGLLDALGIRRTALIGHHTGSVIAGEIAAAYPDRVAAAVLSGMPYIDAARRQERVGVKVIDETEAKEDGAHLLDLWRMRQPHYPPHSTDLLERFVIDALKAGKRAPEGHKVVNRYKMDERLPLITCPVLIVAPTEDPHVYNYAPRIQAAIPGSRIVEIPGGKVPLPNQLPEDFAKAATDFLKTAIPR